ncbi:tRNA-splicing ligase [Thiohalorhabdus denitrificans]|uniref:tRNA-splicing ligase RtcB n=1 Tax=Thiohalorhabdus denitrificans TaxID=381306 RepID=A0A0N8PMZ8_9GAMM|nr:RtcB family protein [Thiohalorhabdus denitrificans]KPV40125.1 tRNA-splicing ligase [Thiohalorhabdus denitrificans]SCY16805.1 tRNA-splicing ligase RtcB [Thiohalorhabdus denitrificans]
MDIDRLHKVDDFQWVLEPERAMRVPGVLYADEALLEGMDDRVLEQVANVAALPGIVKASYAMPDAHWGYGFPIGGVAAFDPDAGGVVSAGGVGFDISCGVRTLRTGVTEEDIRPHQKALADMLFHRIPAGLGSHGKIHLSPGQMDDMLAGGARWAVQEGYGEPEDLERIEEYGCMPGADPGQVSARAKERQKDEMGTLGSGNHYLEVQKVAAVYDPDTASAFGLREGDVVMTIHCGSRGLGHQIGTETLKSMARSAPGHGIELPDRELACAPLRSPEGQAYLGAMRAGINCALANREIITHLARQGFQDIFPEATLELLYDVSHNTCKEEEHRLDGETRRLFVHRKGATRAFGPGNPNLPRPLRPVGQPVLIGGTMGTASYILVGEEGNETRSFGSSCHGAGRRMSRNQAKKQWRGDQVVRELAHRGILIRSPSMRGVAEEAPGAYKAVEEVVEAAESAGLSRRVARVEPLVTIKG